MSQNLTTSEQQELLQLRQDVSRMGQIFEAMPSGLVILDGAGVVEQANAAAVSLLDEPLVGESWLTVIKRAFRLRNDDGHEVSLIDGRRVQLSMIPRSDGPGQLILLTDLTQTRALQDRIAHLKRLSSLGKMAASLAHQIRTPLSAAMLYAANLANKTLSSSARERFCNKLVLRLGELEKQINDMLLFARSGEQQIVETLGVQELLSSIEQSSEAMVNLADAKLSVKIEASCAILANSNALTSALTNLLQNALDAGAKQIVMHGAEEQGQFTLTVHDDGKGMSDDVIAQVFEPFFTTRSQGTGLGLAVVQAVVRAHQGQVSVHSVPGEGSCFTLSFPVLGEVECVTPQWVGGAA